jgi:hypothetical protein
MEKTTFFPTNSDSFQGEGEEAARMQVCRLIRMMVKTNRICNALKASAEIVSSIDRNDIPDLLQLIWNSLHHRQGAPISTSPVTRCFSRQHPNLVAPDAHNIYIDR